MLVRENLSERGWGHALLDLDDDGLGAPVARMSIRFCVFNVVWR
jgi:hypothetical protein